VNKRQKKLSYIGITEHKKDVYNHIQRVRKFGEQLIHSNNESVRCVKYYGSIVQLIQIYYLSNKKSEKRTIFVSFKSEIKLYLYFYSAFFIRKFRIC
jgi:hypothetical protein